MQAMQTWTRIASGGLGLVPDAAPGAVTDNRFSTHRLRTFPGEVGIWIAVSGPDVTPDLSVLVWLYETTQVLWLKLVTLSLPELTIVRQKIPNTFDLTGQIHDVAFQLQAAALAPDGTYTFMAGTDFALL